MTTNTERTARIKMNRHSVWDHAGLLIQATNQPGIYRFANLNPETSFKHALTRWQRIRLGLWFIVQAAYR